VKNGKTLGKLFSKKVFARTKIIQAFTSADHDFTSPKATINAFRMKSCITIQSSVYRCSALMPSSFLYPSFLHTKHAQKNEEYNAILGHETKLSHLIVTFEHVHHLISQQ
jgi:hypothetical protein